MPQEEEREGGKEGGKEGTVSYKKFLAQLQILLYQLPQAKLHRGLVLQVLGHQKNQGQAMHQLEGLLRPLQSEGIPAYPGCLLRQPGDRAGSDDVKNRLRGEAGILEED